MRISLELEPADIERFHAALARARRAAACADEFEVIEAAKYALDHLNTADVPAFVRKRVVEVQKLIVMLEDEAWALSGPERADIVGTLVYFSDPDDLIPDEIEVIGLLDDAILLELLLQRMRHVRKAYADFCSFRSALEADIRDAEARRAHARDLAALRTRLQERMRRARPRDARREADSKA
ncbi:MAG: YkvA family protein [Dokdonella sp.]|uniref:YkvA family protein n=1 Tax=Dokdonella sp. TaxID=2291710 RepID=UPI003F80D093